jgi:transposase
VVSQTSVGIDIAKEFHWVSVTVPDPATGKAVEVLSRRVGNDPDDIAAVIEQIKLIGAEHDAVTVGIDVLGGIARLVEVMLLQAGLDLVHVPGLAVKTARRATRGGEHKSDPRDARVIADLVRARDDLRRITAASDADVTLGLLVSRRRELVVDQTRRIGRLRDLLCSVHPGLERVTDPTHKVDLVLLARYVTPAEIRRAGQARITSYLLRSGRHHRSVVDRLVSAALAAADAQRISVPGEQVAAAIVKDLAAEALDVRAKIDSLDSQIAELVDSHPDAALVRSLPGMGAILTAEFLAAAGGIIRYANGDQLASAAGLAPVLQQSGKVRYLQRATSGDRTLKMIFYQAAFCALQRDPASRTYYDRKRREGKTHHQAVIALARRRVNVLHAILRTRQPYRPQPSLAA